MKDKKALVTAIGSFSADIVVKSLKTMGFTVVGTDIYEKDWVAVSQEVDKFFQAPYASETEKYLSFIKETVEKEKIDCLLPLIDVEIDVLNQHREELEALGVKLCISPKEAVKLLRNKLKLTEKVRDWLSSCGTEEFQRQIRTIPTELASDVDFETVSYPLILKPIDGRSSSGLYRIYQEDQLGFAFSNICDPTKLQDTSLETYLVQPMIKGNIITVDIVRDRQGHVNVAAREELLRTPNGAGLSVKLFRDPVLENFCREIAGTLQIEGAVNFEFIRGEGSGIYYFVECNPRFSGGVAFSVLAGLPVVEDSMKVFLGESISEEKELETGFMTRKFVECRMQ